ncbi:hypothetical protein NC651_023496 [Populus alba x Populus x berolinensis]|nr:hypothetical protein NC651_023496 [Populus alba x Populus x berolinensis]
MTIFSIDQSLCRNGTRLLGAFCCHGLLSLLEEDVDQLPSTADVTVHHQNGSNRACLRVGTCLQQSISPLPFNIRVFSSMEKKNVSISGWTFMDKP